jgi:predicted transcriptional regulator
MQKKKEGFFVIHIKSHRKGLAVFKALSSETRIDIVELLAAKGPMRMTAIAEALNITGGAITTHMKLLQEANIVQIKQMKGKHGVQKICQANDTEILVDSPVKK